MAEKIDFDNNDEFVDKRVDGIINLLTEYSKGNFSAREDVSNTDDALSTVASGLNMFGEELDYWHRQNNKYREFLQNILSSIDEVVYARSIREDHPSLSPFTFISARAKEIIGCDAGELEAEPDKWINAMHSDDRKLSVDFFNRILQGRDAVFIYRLFHSERKEYRWIEDRIVSKKDENGKVVEIYGSARDITDQQNINIELDQKNKLISRLITSSDQAFYVIAIDPENSFKNTCTYLSWQIQKIQGSTFDEVKNDPLCWIRAIHPDDVEQLKEDNRKMFSSKQPVTRVYRIRHARTNEFVWVEDYIVPITDETGYIKEFYGSARDITQRKRVELEREKLIGELNAKHEELMQFNYIVSHNLRSPVASILGLSQLIEELPDDELRSTVRYIAQAATTLDETLRDLNTILAARGSVREKEEVFSLTKLITFVCDTLHREIDETGAIIDVEVDPLADNISSFKSYIQSAVYNLVGNAIKYRSEGRKPVIKIHVSIKSGRTVITVADNGIGINLKVHRHRMFVLFSRLQTDREGKGLGLYMTKKQIEALGGTLDVESMPGAGTTFTITL